MLTMSHTCNASDRGGGGWKESYRSTDSVESTEESADSDHSSSSSSRNAQTGGGSPGAGNNGPNSAPHQPIGCITTHRVSTVIRPERKMPPIDPLQFVKVKKNDLCIKAVEQIKLAEEVKITKEKIKEEEEEWQNNLLSWKSKRKLTKNNSDDDSLMTRNPNRKTKTFSEILIEKAKSGGRIGYNLQQYVDMDDEERQRQQQQMLQQFSQDNTGNNGQTCEENDNEDNYNYQPSPLATSGGSGDDLQHSEDNCSTSVASNDGLNGNDGTGGEEHNQCTMPANSNNNIETNLDRFQNSFVTNGYLPPNGESICRNGLGDIVVYNTTLLEEFCVKTSDSSCDRVNQEEMADEQRIRRQNSQSDPKMSPKVNVSINDWKHNHPHHHKLTKQQTLSQSSDEDGQQPQQAVNPQHNSSFEVEDDDEELDEELERLRLDQERSFKAKLYAFESLAKQEEEAARRATEANRRRQQNRAKLAAERSKSLCNIQQTSNSGGKKAPLVSSHSVSSSMIPSGGRQTESIVTESVAPTVVRSHFESQPTNSKSLQNLSSKTSPNSVVYNFKEKSNNENKKNSSESSKQQPAEPVAPSPQMNIYENITPKPKTIPEEPVADSDAIRNASQKLLQQQQQIYQNQPLPTGQFGQYSSIPYPNGGYQTKPDILPVQPTDTILNDKVINPVPIRGGYTIVADDVGLPPIQITKTSQSVYNGVPAPVAPEEHLYQNQQQMFKAANSIPTYSNYDSFHDNEPNYENKAMFIRKEDAPPSNPAAAAAAGTVVYSTDPYAPINATYANAQYNPLYYPKPYTANGNTALKQQQQQQQVVSKQPTQPVMNVQNGRYPQPPPNGHRVAYNQNHWLIQEAEFRRQLDSIEPGQRMKNGNSTTVAAPPANGISQPKGNGYLSVSGKKKCSSCGDELGKGCAAMVVESLSLYYHINCFRCSVCNIQLGNGTVGTDVRVRNNKLHCQNCYSNDEAGLKFSRV